MRINPLPSSFGVEIHDLDIRSIDDNAMRVLTKTLYENLFVVIRGQKLEEEEYLSFGRCWGKPIPVVVDHVQMAGYPDLMCIGNTLEKDWDDAVRLGSTAWHTDQSYELVPASATMLYSIKVPKSAGETEFCDMRSAYRDLDDSTKGQADGLQVAHQYGRGVQWDEHGPVPTVSQEQDDRLPVVYQPLVMKHHIIESKALYALGNTHFDIEGMVESDGKKLLARLRSHCLQDCYCYSYRYKVGDVAIWDTFQTMHRAQQIRVATGKDDARLLWRISVRGKPKIYLNL